MLATAMFMYKVCLNNTYIILIFCLGWLGGSKFNENCKQKICSAKILFTNVTHYRCSKKPLIVK